MVSLPIAVPPEAMRPPADTLEDLDEPTHPSIPVGFVPSPPAARASLISSSYPALNTRLTAPPRGRTALMQVPPRAQPPPRSVSAPIARGWEIDSVAGCVIAERPASSGNTLTFETRFERSVSPWTIVLGMCVTLIAIVVATGAALHGPQPRKASAAAAPQTVTPPPTPVTLVATESAAAAPPPPQPIASARLAMKPKPPPKPVAARPVTRATVVKAPSLKSGSVSQRETTEAIEALRQARMEAAASFGE